MLMNGYINSVYKNYFFNSLISGAEFKRMALPITPNLIPTTVTYTVI